MEAYQGNPRDQSDPSLPEEEDSMVEEIVGVGRKEPYLVGLVADHVAESHAKAGLVVGSELDERGPVKLDSEELGEYPAHNVSAN
jgi:hypothetical protein